MKSTATTREEMWSKQNISGSDVNFDSWKSKKEILQKISQMSPGCLFAVDVYQQYYCFASDNFASLFGYPLSQIRTIEKQEDLLESRIHPKDREQMIQMQIRHSQFIYSLPATDRNNYQTIYQFRVKNAGGNYINVISRQQVFETDRNRKAWIILGNMEISPDQRYTEHIYFSCMNRINGEIFSVPAGIPENPLTNREKEILCMIREGLLSKEIAERLHVSIHTVHNHRKNILAKLGANNSIEAINYISGKKLAE